MLDKFRIWFYDRIGERSTRVAIIGLLPFIFRYSGIPQDMIAPLVDVVAAFLLTAAITKG